MVFRLGLVLVGIMVCTPSPAYLALIASGSGVCGSGWLEGGSCNPAPSHLLVRAAILILLIQSSFQFFLTCCAAKGCSCATAPGGQDGFRSRRAIGGQPLRGPSHRCPCTDRPLHQWLLNQSARTATWTVMRTHADCDVQALLCEHVLCAQELLYRRWSGFFALV